jgi:hypothetical protein
MTTLPPIRSVIALLPRPLIAHPQAIEMGSGQPPLMLHTPHHDARSNAVGCSRRNQLIPRRSHPKTWPCEPEVIVGFVAQAQGDQRPVAAQPAGGPAHPAAC